MDDSALSPPFHLNPFVTRDAAIPQRSDSDHANTSRFFPRILHRRCLELEYRLATHSKSSDINGGVGGCGRGVAFGGGKEIGGEGGGRHESTASSETFPSSASSTPPPPVAGEVEVEVEEITKQRQPSVKVGVVTPPSPLWHFSVGTHLDNRDGVCCHPRLFWTPVSTSFGMYMHASA